jgi:5-methylcytosine-specific restriction enzyme subunit McrC
LNIPVGNIYYLLIYAWNMLSEADVVDVDPSGEVRLINLFARILNRGTDQAIRRGLDRGYVPLTESIPGIRGKLNISASVKSGVMGMSRMVCEFDEFTHNIIHNRIVKSTLGRLLCAKDLDNGLREEVVATLRRLVDIDDIALTSHVFRSVQLNRNNRFYFFLMRICRLIHDKLMIDPLSGESKFRKFTEDPIEMRHLFERFVRGFYRHEQSRFDVGRENFVWQQTGGASASIKKLPRMTTDVSLTDGRRKIIFETKFVPQVFQMYREKRTVRSSHLYQLFAYLQNLAIKSGDGVECEGILLYPMTDEKVDFRFRVQNHWIRVCTVDLTQHWSKIRENLLQLLEPLID